MELPTYFSDFLQEIRPTPNQKEDSITGHRTLTKRLLEDEDLSKIIVSTFLQGSYRRATAVRPKGDSLSDVDVVVVTLLDENKFTPQQAMNVFKPFLEKHYKSKYEFRGRSIRIKLSYVELDLVITSAPAEAEARMLKSASVTTEDSLEDLQDLNDWKLAPSWVALAERSMPGAMARMEVAKKEAEWKLSPLRIPDREAQEWDDTDPLEQIKWTWAKNSACNKHYVNVVKALKWWKRVNHETPKYPKGYPLEHLIGDCCPSEITSVAAGVTLTLETIAEKYRAYALSEQAPPLKDHGVDHNVFHRITGADFAEFHAQVCDAAAIARRALDADTVRKSAGEWCKLFGSKFPEPPPEDNDNGGTGSSPKSGGYTPRAEQTSIGGRRYA